MKESTIYALAALTAVFALIMGIATLDANWLTMPIIIAGLCVAREVRKRN